MSDVAEGNAYRLMETRPRLLAKFFQRSRDNWKRKYQQVKGEIKGFQIRVRDLEQSREQWRDEAERSRREQQRLAEECRQLQERLAASDEVNKKKVTRAS